MPDTNTRDEALTNYLWDVLRIAVHDHSFELLKKSGLGLKVNDYPGTLAIIEDLSGSIFVYTPSLRNDIVMCATPGWNEPNVCVQFMTQDGGLVSVDEAVLTPEWTMDVEKDVAIYLKAVEECVPDVLKKVVHPDVLFLVPQTEGQAVEWLEAVWDALALGFHWDTRGKNYITTVSSMPGFRARLFTDEQAEDFDAACMTVAACDWAEDVYLRWMEKGERSPVVEVDSSTGVRVFYGVRSRELDSKVSILFQSREAADEVVPVIVKESKCDDWEVSEVESYAEHPNPPISLHNLDQPLVQALWMEARLWREMYLGVVRESKVVK